MKNIVTNKEGRIIIIGDLHGCYQEALELLDVCKVTKKDTVIFAGDLVDRGPDNNKCVNLAADHLCILGNHEETHLMYNDREKKGQDPNVRADTHVATRAQLTPEHYDYFRSLPLYFRLPQYNSVVVHAGVWPGLEIERQSEHHLLHAQCINPLPDQDKRIDRGSKWPSKAPPGYKFWTHWWKGPERIIFGHSVLNQPLVTEFAVGIDGGAVFGRELWAYELPSGTIHRVKSKTNADKGHRGRNIADSIKIIEIHDGIGTFS